MGDRLSGVAPWRRSRIVVPVTTPAAGSDWSVTVPAGHIYRVRSVYATLLTAVAVANRDAMLNVGDGVRTFVSIPPVAVQAASLTYTYAWFPHAGALNVGNGQAVPIPELDLMAGWTLGTSTGSIQAADQWSGIWLLVDDVTVERGPIDVGSMPEFVVEIAGGSAS